jgi:hypothetical protein
MKTASFFSPKASQRQLPGFGTACATKMLELLFLLALPTVLEAQFTFSTNGDNTITITGYTGPGGVVTIPDTTDGLPVTSVGDYAFYNCTNLTDVTIGTNVTSIGGWAFSSCTGLSSVTFSNSVTTIGTNAFSFCISLRYLTIPSGVKSIKSEAFAYCSSLTEVYFQPGLSDSGGIIMEKVAGTGL